VSGLGIATLIFSVPIALAHQATALILSGLAVWRWRATVIEQDTGSVACVR